MNKNLLMSFTVASLAILTASTAVNLTFQAFAYFPPGLFSHITTQTIQQSNTGTGSGNTQCNSASNTATVTINGGTTTSSSTSSSSTCK